MLTHTRVSEVLLKHLRQRTASLTCILQSVTLRPLGLRQPANAAAEQSLEEDACPRQRRKSTAAEWARSDCPLGFSPPRLLFCANSSGPCTREAWLPALEFLTQLIRRPQTKAYVLTPSSMPHT